jgi:hypothetical protein
MFLSEKSVSPIYDFKAIPQTKFESGTLPKKIESSTATKNLESVSHRKFQSSTPTKYQGGTLSLIWKTVPKIPFSCKKHVFVSALKNQFLQYMILKQYRKQNLKAVLCEKNVK